MISKGPVKVLRHKSFTIVSQCCGGFCFKECIVNSFFSTDLNEAPPPTCTTSTPLPPAPQALPYHLHHKHSPTTCTTSTHLPSPPQALLACTTSSNTCLLSLPHHIILSLHLKCPQQRGFLCRNVILVPRCPQ